MKKILILLIFCRLTLFAEGKVDPYLPYIINAQYQISEDEFLDKSRAVNEKLQNNSVRYLDNKILVMLSDDTTNISEINFHRDTLNSILKVSFSSYLVERDKPKRFIIPTTNFDYQVYDQEILGKNSKFFGSPYNVRKQLYKFVPLDMINPGIGMFYLLHDPTLHNGKTMAYVSSIFFFADILAVTNLVTGSTESIRWGKGASIGCMVFLRAINFIFWKPISKGYEKVSNSGYHIEKTW